MNFLLVILENEIIRILNKHAAQNENITIIERPESLWFASSF